MDHSPPSEPEKAAMIEAALLGAVSESEEESMDEHFENGMEVTTGDTPKGNIFLKD
jgi:hypothetical protein